MRLRFVNLPEQLCSVAVILFQCGKEMLQSDHQCPERGYQQTAVMGSQNKYWMQ